MSACSSSRAAHLQRFALVHLALKEIATGSGPDEAASIDELSESILHVYAPVANGHTNESSRTSSASIRLAGIATAFWSLPSSLGVESSQKDSFFQFITLSNSNLLLTLLEENILAVFLFSKDALINPGAIATSILRHYHLFCLVFGGGIHQRLLRSSNFASSTDQTCAYPGMKELYELHRKIRKYKGDQANEQVSIWKDKVAELRSNLTITKLRSDLKEHFDQYCIEWEALRLYNPACGRSIVCRTPAPIPGTVAARWYSRDCSMDWQHRLKEIFDHTDRPGCILGVSVFTHGHFQGTVMSRADYHISTKTACLAMYYLASIRVQIPGDHEPVESGFIRRTLGGFLHSGQQDSTGTFLRPPFLSLLSAGVQHVATCSIGERKENPVWIPELTVTISGKSIRGCLYRVRDDDFLIYLDPTKESMFSNALEDFAASLADVSWTRTSNLLDEWDMSGQNIIWVDRRNQITVVHSSNSKSARPGQTMSHPDERYELASLLSLDTLLALDDAMEHAIHESPNRYESCTLLWKNWFVCRSRNEQELYVILDAKQYVTIQDVTIALEKIQEHFGWIG